MISKSKKKLQSASMLEKAYLYILLVIFGGIVLHAPISVGLSTLWPEYSLLIKSWKEILMLVAAIIAVTLLFKKKYTSIIKEPVIVAIIAYGLLHVVIAMFSGSNPIKSIIAGLMIDLRYVLYFALVYFAMRIRPDYKGLFIKVGIAGALVVTVFGLLQVFVLPIDILKYIGYSDKTILPYLTLDANYDFIRINSTLRGPNPLGAYAVIILAGVLAWITSRKLNIKLRDTKLSIFLALSAFICLWTSYSRSATLALVVSILIVLRLNVLKKVSKRIVSIAILLVVMLGVLTAALYKTDLVSNVILHENPNGGGDYTSNEGHIRSLEEGLSRLLSEPFGIGVGSTGSASLYGNSPIIIENQYLFVAHEIGWLGLAIFSAILILVFKSLWARRSNWLALAVFSSGVGLLVINILLPTWTDDTVSIIWWGLAAIVLGGKRND